MTRYSVNVADLTKDIILAQFLIAPVAPSREVISVEKGRFDGVAIRLECDNEQAQAIVDVIRLKYRKHEVRCYRGSKRV